MKGNFISQSKMSKKARKALCKEQRVMWNISPVTRTAASKKAYNRKRKHRPSDDFVLSLFAAWRRLPSIMDPVIPVRKKRLP